MAFPEFEVPLTPQDLPAEQTYEMVNASLTALQEASDGVFNRIQDAVEERKGEERGLMSDVRFQCTAKLEIIPSFGLELKTENPIVPVMTMSELSLQREISVSCYMPTFVDDGPDQPVRLICLTPRRALR